MNSLALCMFPSHLDLNHNKKNMRSERVLLPSLLALQQVHEFRKIALSYIENIFLNLAYLINMHLHIFSTSIYSMNSWHSTIGHELNKDIKNT